MSKRDVATRAFHSGYLRCAQDHAVNETQDRLIAEADGALVPYVDARYPAQPAHMDSIREYTELANRTLADDVRRNDLSVLQAEPMAMAILNAASGLASEAGEVNELVKKRFFHNHPWTEDTQAHLKKELGDVAWYWALTCWTHGLDPADVLATNIAKLKARYPEGFSTERSVNRAPGDL